MDVVEIRLVKTDDGQVILSVGGKAIIGVDSLSIGGDANGSFMDVRFRNFGVGDHGEDNHRGDQDEVEDDQG